MSMFEWAALAAILFAIVIFCARIMRRGLSSLDDDRRQSLERIQEGKRKLEEDKKNISADDHLYLMEAAMRDLLRLDDREGDHILTRNDHILEIATPDSAFQVELLMRERSLRSRQRVLHGQSRWLLRGPGFQEEYSEPGELMASLTRHLRGEGDDTEMPGHLAIRLAHAKKASRRKQVHLNFRQR